MPGSSGKKPPKVKNCLIESLKEKDKERKRRERAAAAKRDEPTTSKGKDATCAGNPAESTTPVRHHVSSPASLNTPRKPAGIAMELHPDVIKMTGEEMMESIETLDDEGLHQAMIVPSNLAHQAGTASDDLAPVPISSVIGQELSDLYPESELAQELAELALKEQKKRKAAEETPVGSRPSLPVQQDETPEASVERTLSDVTLTDTQEETEAMLRERYGDYLIQHRLPDDPQVLNTIRNVLAGVCAWVGLPYLVTEITLTPNYCGIHDPDGQLEILRVRFHRWLKEIYGPQEEEEQYYKGQKEEETPTSTGASEDDTRSEEAKSVKFSERSKTTRTPSPPPHRQHTTWGPIYVHLKPRFSDLKEVVLELPFEKYRHTITTERLNKADTVEFLLVQEGKYEYFKSAYFLNTMVISPPHGYFKTLKEDTSSNEEK